MNWVDGHLDLAYLAATGRDMTVRTRPADPGAVSLPDLREAGIDLVFATIFTEAGPEHAGEPYGYLDSNDLDAAERAGRLQLEWYEQMEEAGELSIVRRSTDLEVEGSSPKVVILMEGADPIRNPDRVSWWHSRGVRLVGLSWSYGSRYSGGNAKPGGLTSAGRELVAALDEHGMAHDVSHLSDESFEDLLETAKGRVMASHSNARSLLGGGIRHLSDAHLAKLLVRDAIVGLNLFGPFLTATAGARATINDCMEHLEHVSRIIGRNRVALGSDMDGGFGRDRLPIGIGSPQDVEKLVDELDLRGWSESEIEGFATENWLRFLRSVLA